MTGTARVKAMFKPSDYPGMPDDDGGNQNYIRTQTFFQWDDLQDISSNLAPGYYVEYVPEPSTMAIGLSMCALLLMWRLRGANLRSVRR